MTVRVTNADVAHAERRRARVGVKITATLYEDGSKNASGANGALTTASVDQHRRRVRTDIHAVATDEGKRLRAVFTYADGDGQACRERGGAGDGHEAFGAADERAVAENSAAGTEVGRRSRPPTTTRTIWPTGWSAAGRSSRSIPRRGRSRWPRVPCSTTRATTRARAEHRGERRELADTAAVTVRVTNADDPGKLTLSVAVARVGVKITATLMDEDGSKNQGKRRKWQLSDDGESWTNIAGASERTYTPVATDEGKRLRAVFTYADGHGTGKRAESAAVRVTGTNVAPAFGADAYERAVAENSAAGTEVGLPVTATDDNADDLAYRLVGGGAQFAVDSATGQITVAAGAVLNYESDDTLHALSIEASDGELADTAAVTVRVTNADDPGKLTLSVAVARVGVKITATLMDEDGSKGPTKVRWWERSHGGSSWTDVTGARTRFYTPVTADIDKYLRAVFTYEDGHAPGKRAESAAVLVVGAMTPVVSFGASSYTAPAGGSADVEVLLSPAATAALAVRVMAGDSMHTVTFQTGDNTRTLPVGTAGLSAPDTVAVRFDTLPEGVVAGVPAETRVVVTTTAGETGGDMADSSLPELEVEYAATAYAAVAGGPGTAITLRMTPAADRSVAVPLTATRTGNMTTGEPESLLPDPVVFEPGDSLVTVLLELPPATAPGRVTLGLGKLPEAVSAGTIASATLDIAAAHGTQALLDEALDAGLAVFGRAVAEGARQAVGARIDAIMRPGRGSSGPAAPGSRAAWAGRAAGTLASLAGVPLSGSSLAGTVRRAGSLELPDAREAAGRLLPRISLSTTLGPRDAPGTRPRFGLWAEGSAQRFRGEPGGVRYDGDLRALAIGADARIGSSALAGVSLMRSTGGLDYSNRSASGTLGHAMTSVHPYLFLRPSPGIGLWAMAGYGSGDLDDDARPGNAGATLRMLSAGVQVPLLRSGAFGLALKGDAFTAGMRANEYGRDGSATRARALMEASWTARGLKLATRAGARFDDGDADTGAGAETGGSLTFQGRGLDLALDTRAAFGSGGHREWGTSLRITYDPGTPRQGLRIAVSPARGQPRSGVQRLLDNGLPHPGHPAHDDDWRLDAETGYALPHLGNGSLDTYTRLSAHSQLRLWSAGARYNMNSSLRLSLESALNHSALRPRGLKTGLDLTF